MSRDHILHKVRTAIGRSAGDEPATPPPLLLKIPELDIEARLARFAAALEKLGGGVSVAASVDDARAKAEELIAGRTAVASSAAVLSECGIDSLPGVRSGLSTREDLRDAAARADLGITSADYALADTGSLVMLASPEQGRLVSLLPPMHLAVVPRDRLLTGLDELLTLLPDPSEQCRSMVIITGPSRTADIEQILVRGVHGPGAIHVIFV